MLKNYYKPTPAKYRKLGDAILASSTAMTFVGIQTDDKIIMYFFLILGTVGKFLTNFYTEREK
jgi:hypothetical protein